jgi:cytochrome c
MVRYLVVLSIATLTMFAPAVAAEFGTKEEAIAMVKRVQEQFKKEGPEATFKAVSDKSVKEYHDRDLYPFVYDMRGADKGLNVAHGARPALIGKILIDLKDQDGKYLIREMVDLANGPGHGWVDYKWPNPITSKIEDKSSYIEKMGDYFVGVGAYRQ